MTNSHHHYFTHYHLSLPKFNPLLPESTLQTTARGPPSFKDSPCIFGANDIRGFWGGSETLLVLVLFMNMKTSIHPYQMLKYRYMYVPDIPFICHFFTQTKFLENKINTGKTRKLRQNTQ